MIVETRIREVGGKWHIEFHFPSLNHTVITQKSYDIEDQAKEAAPVEHERLMPVLKSIWVIANASETIH